MRHWNELAILVAPSGSQPMKEFRVPQISIWLESLLAESDHKLTPRVMVSLST